MEVSRGPFWVERYRLGALRRQDLLRILLLAGVIGMLYLLFHLLGNTEQIGRFDRSVFTWMVTRWANSSISFNSTDYSHGFLIPLVSLALVWARRQELWAAPKHVNYLGLLLLIGFLALHWAGAKAQQPRPSLVAFIGVLWSVPFYLYGWQVARIVVFPCAYLVFCIPMYFLDALTQPLQLLMVDLSSLLLNGLGLEVQVAGTEMRMVRSGGSFDVAAPCSGLRSLLAMTALTAVYAYFNQKTLWRKWLLFACSIPLAIAGNVARVVSIVLVSEVAGKELALGIYHDYAGFVVFGVAIALMVAAGNLLESNLLERIRSWNPTQSDPISSPSA